MLHSFLIAKCCVLAELTGQIIRLEFYLQDADLYSFRADDPAR
ncbi:MAG: hypothetical protein O3C40_21105 [Planctomycetota bacterium]|nr:hypothetical protein [Planctomycetota bacterium]